MANPVETDPEIAKYLPRFAGEPPPVSDLRLGQVSRPGRRHSPPAEAEAETGLGIYHPDHEGRFASVPAFLAWSSSKGQDSAKLPALR